MLLGVASITSTAQTVKSIEIAGHIFNASKNSQTATGKYYESETRLQQEQTQKFQKSQHGTLRPTP